MVALADAAGPLLVSLESSGTSTELALLPGKFHTIGRGRGSVLQLQALSVSGKHVELSVDVAPGGQRLRLLAKNISRNGTAIRHPHLAGETDVGVFRDLNSNEAEELLDGTELRLPNRAIGELQTIRLTVRLLSAGRLGGGAVPKSVSVPATPAVGLRVGESPLGSGALPDVYDPDVRTGRWRYEAKLGEGGLGVVYRAFDVTGKLGEVAVKVLKPRSSDPRRDARFVFEMHRESQWSLWWLHNEFDSRYDKEASKLFARYHEDHTGFASVAPTGFDSRRKMYESPDFDWERHGPTLPAQPYVVMELVRGEDLHHVIDREFITRSKSQAANSLPLTKVEKRDLILQAARALEYLEKFSLIHRDFRGCNMHVVKRTSLLPDGAESSVSGSCLQLKVLDLGIMISADAGQEMNKNEAVRAFKKRGDTEEKRRRYDWLPWEVRAGADGSAPVNFAWPKHSFDMFSLGMLIAHMLIGRQKARSFLDSVHNNAHTTIETRDIGIPPSLLLRMLGEASKRPRPVEVISALGFVVRRQEQPPGPRSSGRPIAPPSIVEPPRHRSRSRSLGGAAAPVPPLQSRVIPRRTAAPAPAAALVASPVQVGRMSLTEALRVKGAVLCAVECREREANRGRVIPAETSIAVDTTWVLEFGAADERGAACE